MTDERAPLLEPTWYLDWDHPEVARFAREATGSAANERERAVLLFYAVRDRLLYDPYSIRLERERFRASAILAGTRGFCVSKAILLAAAARATGIPARLGFADVRNHLATPRLLELMRTDVFAFHAYADLFVEDTWVKATPAFDRGLCARMKVPPLEWDGRADALLQPHDGEGRRHMEYVRDRGRFDDFPFEAMVDSWREVYPHFFEGRPRA